MDKTKIDWCDSTWNPVTGCNHGCKYCYARGIAERFAPFDFQHLTEDGVFKHLNDLKNPIITVCKDEKERICAYPYGFEPTFHRYRLNDYIGKQGRNIFVCSMADLFGDWVPDSWIEEVFKACEKAMQHNYLFLTKNLARYDRYGVKAYTKPGIFNLWYGMSVTTKEQFNRTWILPEYCNTFISIEPILEDLQVVKGDLRLSCLDWVIIGAETGWRKDKVVPKRKWIEDIVNECRNAYGPIPVFMKFSLAEIWGEPLIQEFPDGLKKK